MVYLDDFTLAAADDGGAGESVPGSPDPDPRPAPPAPRRHRGREESQAADDQDQHGQRPGGQPHGGKILTQVCWI